MDTIGAIREHIDLLVDTEVSDLFGLILEQRSLAALRPEIPRVGLLGTFKAGKSTLVNALLGGSHAATDDLELTAVTTILLPEAGDRVLVEDVAGTGHSVPLGEWRQRAANVRRDPGWWTDFVSATVPTGSETGVVLVDTPGMGVMTPGRAERARGALGLCDAVIWVLSADRLGDVEEGRELRHLQSTGLPLLLALNKCDLLEPEEIEEAIAWVEDAFPWAINRVHPVSARAAESAVAHAESPSRSCGVHALREAIEHLSRDPHGLRARARSAVQADLNLRAERLHSRIAGRLRPEIERRTGTLEIVRRRGELVLRRVKKRLRERVETEFLAEVEQELLRSRGDDLRATVNAALGDERTSAFWGRVVSDLPGTLVDEWGAGLEILEGELSDVLEVFSIGFAAQLAPQLEDVVAQVTRAADDQAVRDGGLVTAAAVAGAGYVAWLGPAAAAVSFGAALTTVALPVAVLGGGMVMVRRHLAKQQAADQLRSEVASLLGEARERVWTEFVEPQLLPRIGALHAEILARFEEELGAEELRRMQSFTGARTSSSRPLMLS